MVWKFEVKMPQMQSQRKQNKTKKKKTKTEETNPELLLSGTLHHLLAFSKDKNHSSVS